MVAALAALVLGTLLARGKDVFDFTNEMFGSFVAVTGDAHQAKVAQDIFRQEIRYERSLQIREDIRDVNKMMLESVQTHLFVGSIILGVCFAIFIEGHPPSDSSRLLIDLWIVFCCWSATFTLISLWLALCFQAQISHCARERLLRKHRFQMPDDQVVGKMGGGSLISQMALFHDRVLELVSRTMATKQPEEDGLIRRKKRQRKSSLRVQVEAKDGSSLDAVPVEKGVHAWLYRSGDALSNQTVLDIPSYLIGETLIRSRWFCNGDYPFMFRVRGEATLYIAAQCPPSDREKNGKSGIAALQLNGVVPEWPSDQLPFVSQGYHPAWRGSSGHGEFRRVNGFSVFVEKAHIEMPLYKIVLGSPPDDGDGMVDVQVDWRFANGCEGLLIIARRGHVHCKEEDWPIVEFNEEIKQVMPLRDYSGLYMRYGVFCLILAAFFTCCARLWVEDLRVIGWFEMILLALGLFPALLAVIFIPIHQTGAMITQTIQSANMVVGGQGHAAKLLQRAKPLPVNSTLSDSSDADYKASEELTSLDSDNGPKTLGSGNAVNGFSLVVQEGEVQPDTLSLDPGFDRRGRASLELSSKWRTSPRREWASPGITPRRSRSPSPRIEGTASPRRRSARSPRQAPLGGFYPPLTGEGLSGACGQGIERIREGLIAQLPDIGPSCSALKMAPCREVLRSTNPARPSSRASSPAQRHSTASMVSQVIDEGLPRRNMSDCSIGVRSPSVVLLAKNNEQGQLTPTLMTQDEHVVQKEPGLNSGEAIATLIRSVPEVMRPLDPDKPLMTEGAAAKSLRRTLRKFNIWTRFLRISFALSVCSAASAPYVWVGMVQEALTSAPSSLAAPAAPSPGGATLIAAALTQLPWLEWEVAWPPFFHPTAAALGSMDVDGQRREVLWLAADGVLRAFAAGGGGGGALSPGHALILPFAARGLSDVAGRLAVVGAGAVAEVDVSSVSWRKMGTLASGLLDAVALAAVGPPRSLPLGVAGTADGNSGVLAAAVLSGLDAVAVASADSAPASSAAGDPPSSTSSRSSVVHLCGAGSNASGAAGPLHALGRLGPLSGSIRALSACRNGTCAAEDVLWAAADGGLVAVGLVSGTVLASFAAPRVAQGTPVLLRGASAGAVREGGTVVALAGNASHLVAVVAASGRRPAVFSTPFPALPARGVPLVEL